MENGMSSFKTSAHKLQYLFQDNFHKRARIWSNLTIGLGFKNEAEFVRAKNALIRLT
jgi:hypothetical protein